MPQDVKVLVIILTTLMLIDSIRIILSINYIMKKSYSFKALWFIIAVMVLLSGINNYLISFLAFFNINTFMRLKIGLMIIMKIVNETFFIYIIPKIIKIETSIKKDKLTINDNESTQKTIIEEQKSKIIQSLSDE